MSLSRRRARYAVTGLSAVLILLCVVRHTTSDDDVDGVGWNIDIIEQGRQYVDDPVYRRLALEASLENPQNRYGMRRLAKYHDAGWGGLPVWNPRVKKISPGDIGGPPPTPDFTWQQLNLDVPWEAESLLRLGWEVYTRYPAQLEPAMRTALADLDMPARFGLWQTDDWVGGLLWVELPDGVMPALSCASCHASVDADGQLVPGLPNDDFDLGKALDAHRRATTRNSDWGPGRVDITADNIFNPTLIADLRPVRFQHHLQRAATLRNSLIALAIRLETNVISLTRGAVRPPRKAMFASALYLWDLATALPEPPETGEGRAVFDNHCAVCHAPPGMSGPPTAIDLVGSPRAIADSPFRTTGAYQTPSLRGVSDRKRLTADGSINSLEALLSPDRPQPGHPFGRHLSLRERAALLAFLYEL